MGNIIAILVVLAAVWYLISRFRKMVNPTEPGCGCGCGSECKPQRTKPSESAGD